MTYKRDGMRLSTRKNSDNKLSGETGGEIAAQPGELWTLGV